MNAKSLTSRSQVFKQLLKKCREINIEFGPGFTNHTAHALVALYNLGATNERMNSCFHYSSDGIKKRVNAKSTIHENNFKSMINKMGVCEIEGQSAPDNYFAEFVDFFERQSKKFGWKKTINVYLPDLVNGIVGAATHGIIHLGYGLEVEDEGTIIDGLAYLSKRYLPLGEIEKNSKYGRLSPYEILEKIRNDSTFNSLNGGIMQKLRNLAKNYQNDLKKYDIHLDENIDVSEYVKLFSDVVLHTFYSTGCNDFFCLHCVTSMRATKMVTKYLDTKKAYELLINYWRAFICMFIALGRPNVKEHKVTEDEVKDLSWEKIIQKAFQTDDEHRIKLVYVCYEESKERGNKPFYLHTAYKTLEPVDWNF